MKGGITQVGSRAADLGLEHPVLADEDASLVTAYFVLEWEEYDAYALYPRHYVIDRDGDLAYVSATVSPGDLMLAIEVALATEGASTR